jgi:hypothetical protein
MSGCPDSLEPRQRAHAPCNLITVHFRQSDIQEHDIGLECYRWLERLTGRIDGSSHVPVELERDSRLDVRGHIPQVTSAPGYFSQ